MLKKWLPKSPLGIILTTAAVVLTVSPEARQATRRLVVKGLAGALSVVDQLKSSGTAVQGQVKELLSEARESAAESGLLHAPAPVYDTGIEPVPFTPANQETETASPVNVLNDDYLKKRLELEKHL